MRFAKLTIIVMWVATFSLSLYADPKPCGHDKIYCHEDYRFCQRDAQDRYDRCCEHHMSDCNAELNQNQERCYRAYDECFNP